MKSEASGITGRPRRRVRFWSAKACEGRVEQSISWIILRKGFYKMTGYGKYINRLTFE